MLTWIGAEAGNVWMYLFFSPCFLMFENIWFENVFPSSHVVSLCFPGVSLLCPGTAGRKRNVMLVCVEGLKSAASIRKSEISEWKTKSMICVNKKNEVWSTMFSIVLFTYMFNKMPLKSLENAEIKLEEFERSEKKNKLVFEKERYDSVWQHEIPCPIRLKSTDPGRHAQSFLKSEVRNPKVWIFVFEFAIGLLILGGPGKSPLGNLMGGMMAGDGGRVKIFDCYRRPCCRCCGCGCDWRLWLWSASSILSCVRLGFCMVWKPMVTTHFHCEIQSKTLSQDKLESLPKKGPAERSCRTKSKYLVTSCHPASVLRSSRFPKHPLPVREDQALQAPRSQRFRPTQ